MLLSVASMDELTRLLLVLLVSSKLKTDCVRCHKCYCDGYRHFTAFPGSRLERAAPATHAHILSIYCTSEFHKYIFTLS